MATPISFRTVLEKPAIRSKILEAVSSFWNGPELEVVRNRQVLLDPIQKECFIGALRRHAVKQIKDVWRGDVAPLLARPHQLTCRDVCSTAESLLLFSPISSQDGYERFVGFLESSATIRRTHPPVRVCIGYFGRFGETNQEVLWETEAGFRVRMAGFIPVEDEHAPDHDHGEGLPIFLTSRRAAYFRFEGKCSTLAFRRFRREASRVLRYASWSYVLLKRQDRSSPPRFGGVIEFGLHLRAYFSTPTKKDSVDRRLRNALHLGVQSDQQRHTAIGLALSVAAIESLVCSKGGDLANAFAENTAALLEPDSTYRGDAVEFLKGIYDARSRVLHGDSLEHEGSVRVHARTLAGAVLQAVMERRAFQRSAGIENETPDDLIRELRQGRWVPGQLTGVSESPVRALWGAPYEGEQADSDDEDATAE